VQIYHCPLDKGEGKHYLPSTREVKDAYIIKDGGRGGEIYSIQERKSRFEGRLGKVPLLREACETGGEGEFLPLLPGVEEGVIL